MGEGDVLRADEGVDEVEGVDDSGDDDNVLEDVHARTNGRSLEAVGTTFLLVKTRSESLAIVPLEYGLLGRPMRASKKTYGMTLKRSLTVKLGTTKASKLTCSSASNLVAGAVAFRCLTEDIVNGEEKKKEKEEREEGEEEERKEVVSEMRTGNTGFIGPH